MYICLSFDHWSSSVAVSVRLARSEVSAEHECEGRVHTIVFRSERFAVRLGWCEASIQRCINACVMVTVRMGWGKVSASRCRISGVRATVGLESSICPEMVTARMGCAVSVRIYIHTYRHEGAGTFLSVW